MKIKINKDSTPFILTFIFVFFLYLFQNPRFESVEKNIYLHYTTSVVDDFDLNLLNQVPEKDLWQVTKTYNYPDMHSNAIVSLWTPYFLYKKVIGEKSIVVDKLIRSIVTYFFGFLNLILLWKLLKVLYPDQKDMKPILMMLIGSSYWWYTLIQVGNSDVTLSAYTTMGLFLYLFRSERISISSFFIWGLYFGLGIGIKIDILFYLILPLFYLISAKADFKKYTYFLLGFLLPLGLVILNDFIKLGYLGNGYKDAAQLAYYNLFENFFAPSGNLLTSPFYILIVIFFTVIISSFKSTSLKYVVLLSIPFIEIVIESVGRIHQENFGARHWVNDFGVMVLILSIFYFKYITNFFRKRFLYSCLFFSFLISSLLLYMYNFEYDRYFVGNYNVKYILVSISNLGFIQILRRFFSADYLHEKILVLPLFLLLTLVLIRVARYIHNSNIPKILGGIEKFVVATVLIYLCVTTGNFFNNQIAAAEYKNSLMAQKSMVGTGPYINTALENIGTYEKVLMYYSHRNNKKMAIKISEEKNQYIRQAILEISHDPLNIKDKLLNSDKFIDDELRDD